ncbi:type II secretion system F family protein [Candidatus Roizmanbacteria bacterium]|nr:type II secretion system F family protein [Candidatus Roizmanbacteria bacterium]
MNFWYKALKKDKVVTGKLNSTSSQEVVGFLKKNGYIPIEVKKQESILPQFDSVFNRINFTDIVDFTRQMAIMLNAGLTLIDCFNILEKQIKKTELLALVQSLNKEVTEGNTYSSALKKYPEQFSNLYIALVKSGEASGKLSEILLKLAENLEKQREFNSKIKSALTYPVIVVIGMLGVMFVMITFVVPKLLGLYKDFNVDLPASTKILIALSDFSARFWPLIIIAVFAFVTLFKKYTSTKQGKLLFDTVSLNFPAFGSIIKISALVDTTRTLAILIASGVSILDGLNIIIETTGNLVYRNSFINIYKQVEKGFALGTSMDNEGIYPPILVQMTTVGEQTGKLDDTLMRISRYFEAESEIAVKSLTTLIEPLILVVLGIGVGFLVISVITPIYNLTSAFK